jgi:hypothetical protein
MTALLFLSVDSETPIASDVQPLLNPELRSISAAYITPGAPSQDFCKSKRLILFSNDDARDLESTLLLWSGIEPPSFIFAFDAHFVVRRIAAYCVSKKVRFLPAYYWCGAKSRTVDICHYLTGERETTPIELLRAAGINVPGYYVPHNDSVDDLKYLISLADKYGIVKASVVEEQDEIPNTNEEGRTIKVPRRNKLVTKTTDND